MSEVDWKILESRRSCALLSRDEMLDGKVPTTPTTASVIAGVQVQEAVKQLHGLPTMAGQGLAFDGLSGETYRVQYPRKPDCMGHDRHQRLGAAGPAAWRDMKVGDLLARARKDLGPEAVVGLSRDIIVRLVCPDCGRSDERFASLGKVKESEAACPALRRAAGPGDAADAGPG